MTKDHFTRVINRMAEGGLLHRAKAEDLIENYDHVAQQLDDTHTFVVEDDHLLHASICWSQGSLHAGDEVTAVEDKPKRSRKH